MKISAEGARRLAENAVERIIEDAEHRFKSEFERLFTEDEWGDLIEQLQPDIEAAIEMTDWPEKEPKHG